MAKLFAPDNSLSGQFVAQHLYSYRYQPDPILRLRLNPSEHLRSDFWRLYSQVVEDFDRYWFLKVQQDHPTFPVHVLPLNQIQPRSNWSLLPPQL